jgi:hypothetical protein
MLLKILRKNYPVNKDRFYESLEGKVLPKIEEDIDIILTNNWAGEVSPQDLYHCHVLIPQFYPVDTEGYGGLISADEVQLLYHSRESQNVTHGRNIMSSLGSRPKTVNGKRTLNPVDLKCWDSCQINFGLNEEDLNAQEYKFDKVVKRGKYHFGMNPHF